MHPAPPCRRRPLTVAANLCDHLTEKVGLIHCQPSTCRRGLKIVGEGQKTLPSTTVPIERARPKTRFRAVHHRDIPCHPSTASPLPVSPGWTHTLTPTDPAAADCSCVGSFTRRYWLTPFAPHTTVRWAAAPPVAGVTIWQGWKAPSTARLISAPSNEGCHAHAPACR